MSTDDSRASQSSEKTVDELKLHEFLLPFSRKLGILVGLPLGIGMLAAVLTLVRPTEFIALSTFAPQSSAASSISTLAAQFGLTVPTTGEGPTLQFYARLVKSRVLLEPVARGTYNVGGTATTFVDAAGAEGDSAEALSEAVDLLEDAIRVSVDVEAGVIEVATSTHSPELSEQVNRRLLDLVNEFNLQKRQTQAGAERDFIEERLTQVATDLKATEDSLADFLNANRTYQSSPELSFEAARLERDILWRQQVYTSLADALEQARIEEVRNTPVITVVDDPEGSAEPAGGIVRNGAVGVLLGFLLAFGWIVVAEYFSRLRVQNPASYDELVGRRKNALRRLLPRTPGRR